MKIITPQTAPRGMRPQSNSKIHFTSLCAVQEGPCLLLGNIPIGSVSVACSWTLYMHRPCLRSKVLSSLHASKTSKGLELQVGIETAQRAQVTNTACPTSPPPKKINAMAERWISPSSKGLVCPNTSLRAELVPRKTKNGVVYVSTMQNKTRRFDSHELAHDVRECDRRRRFELNSNLPLSWSRENRRVTEWIYPMLSFRSVTKILITSGRASLPASGKGKCGWPKTRKSAPPTMARIPMIQLI